MTLYQIILDKTQHILETLSSTETFSDRVMFVLAKNSIHQEQTQIV